MDGKEISNMKFSVVQVAVLILLAGAACLLFGVIAGYTYRGMRVSRGSEVSPNVGATASPVSTQAPTRAVPPTWTPEPSDVQSPTWTPGPTDTPVSTWTPNPTTTPLPTVAWSLGRITVDQWELLVTDVESLPGQSPNQQIVVIFVTLANQGSEGTFSPYYTLELMDAQGRRYTDDVAATSNVRNRYGIDIYADVSMPPESTAEVLYAYIAPASAQTFTIVPGDLVSSWSGDVTFSLP